MKTRLDAHSAEAFATVELLDWRREAKADGEPRIGSASAWGWAGSALRHADLAAEGGASGEMDFSRAGARVTDLLVRSRSGQAPPAWPESRA